MRKDIRLVWFWYGFGSDPNQNHTKTIPKQNQNHTKTIPQRSTGFWYGFEAEPASNLNQKHTKNQ